MPKQGTRVEVNSFVKGLITEASPLNYPSNASLDEVNFTLNRDGTRQRRLGMVYETGFYPHAAPTLSDGFPQTKEIGNTFVWTSPAQVNGTTFLVIQMGNQVNFHKIVKDEPISKKENYLGSVSLTYYPWFRYSFTAINGKLIVAGGGTHVAVVSYNVITKDFSLEYVPIKVRDTWGIEEDKEIEDDPTFRPYTLTDAHEYNLCNQGWGVPRKAVIPPLIDPTPVNPVTRFFSKFSKYPSNSEVVYSGLEYRPVATLSETPYEVMYPNLYDDRFGLNAYSAKGSFVIDLHNRGASRRQAMDANLNRFDPIENWPLPSGKAYKGDYILNGPSCVAAYSGHVFYAGFDGYVVDGDKRSPALTDYVFFSQLVRNESQINLCYQEGDPTSRESNEVVETDGGYFRVLGANKIISLVSLGKHLIVIADNGIWAVSGGSDYGFSATNYRVEKVSTFGCLSASSVVEINNSLLYWGREAIYKLGFDQVGNIVVDDFSSTRINTYYDNIDEYSKYQCYGVYDPIDKKIRWLFREGKLFEDETYQATELIYDTLLDCFFQYQVKGFLRANLVSLFYTQENSIKYICIDKPSEQTNEVRYTMCDYTDPTFRDWRNMNGYGIDAKAYLLTGALTAGDSGIDKQAPYIQIHFKRTETVVGEDGIPKNQSSCMMRCQWEWSNSPTSKKFTDLVETYRYRMPVFKSPGEDYDNGFDTLITKTKLRGKGKAITLYFETSPYKDCHILGWNLTINGNAVT